MRDDMTKNRPCIVRLPLERELGGFVFYVMFYVEIGPPLYRGRARG